MGKLSTQLFENAKGLVIRARKPRQQVVDALDTLLLNQCPGGSVTGARSQDAIRLSEVIVFLEQIVFNEPCNGYTVERLIAGENVQNWIDNRKQLLKSDTEAYMLNGYTVEDLRDTIKSVLPEEFNKMLDKEYLEDMSELIDRERKMEIAKR